MHKQADVYDKILDAAVFFFGVDIDDIDVVVPEPNAYEKKQDVIELIKELPEEPPPEVEEPIEIEEPVGGGGVITYELNKYKIHLPQNLAARLGDYNVDHSYPTLKYLEDLGYGEFDFIINPYHKQYDICDEVVKENPWDLTSTLQNALEDAELKGYPVAPIFWLTHVNSKGFFNVKPPLSPADIPDYAPGLPIDAPEYYILSRKEDMFPNLHPVDVDRYTLAPYLFEGMSLQPSVELAQEVLPEKYEGGRSVTPMTETQERETLTLSEKNIKMKYAEPELLVVPVKVNKMVLVRQPSGFVQIILDGFKGFLLEKNNEDCKVFLSDIDRIVHIPVKYLEPLEIQGVNDKEIEEGDFVITGDDLAIAYGIRESNGELIVYNPELDMFVGVDEWEILEMK